MFDKLLYKITHYTHMPADKILHLFAGLIISISVGYGVVRLSNIDWLFFSGPVAAIIAGCFKEYVWDKFLKKGTFETADMIVTSYGGAIGLTILSVII